MARRPDTPSKRRSPNAARKFSKWPDKLRSLLVAERAAPSARVSALRLDEPSHLTSASSVRLRSFLICSNRGRSRGRSWHQAQNQRLSERAYALWEREGCPEGKADEHWFRTRAFERADASSRRGVGRLSGRLFFTGRSHFYEGCAVSPHLRTPRDVLLAEEGRRVPLGWRSELLLSHRTRRPDRRNARIPDKFRNVRLRDWTIAALTAFCTRTRLVYRPQP
jgi:hypothetical protein